MPGGGSLPGRGSPARGVLRFPGWEGGSGRGLRVVGLWGMVGVGFCWGGVV